MNEERDDIVVLVDENGEEEEFEYIDSIELKGREYIILSPLNQDGDEDDIYDDEEEIVILRVETNEEGEESYVTIEDEKEQEEVFEEFRYRMGDNYYFDFDDEDYEYDEDEDEDEDYEDEHYEDEE
ncbi:MAG: DUF1292 domain-containing protein [Clostridiaceae bacterium]|nr:DUF1292 domain-containing protein [Clostridiaceae bacterium]